ncbi:insulinase family protein [Cronobacter malonaticus]|uniref:insulinase family protein n=1 Tax=Cronobacter malonaticus TaxID=413503 RepID=UPI001F2B499E|nr:insulinase family protein [Cronobacter malonaticus]
MIQTRRLESGITITLIHQPQATQAAALWRVNAGSLHEPDDWPGLAHLLEHMLFRESEGYRDDKRLMRWVPDQGGRLNASTRLCQTAFFFEVLRSARARVCAPDGYARRPLLYASGADAGGAGDRRRIPAAGAGRRHPARGGAAGVNGGRCASHAAAHRQ